MVPAAACLSDCLLSVVCSAVSALESLFQYGVGASDLCRQVALSLQSVVAIGNRLQCSVLAPS